MPYFAQIQNNEVVRVIVADDIAWCQSRLGGNWIETKIDDQTERYAGPGMFAEADHPAKFAQQWRQPTGAEDAYPIGVYVWHNDRIYQCTSPNNVWEPTVFGWRDKTDLIPAWRQPLGAGDVWNLNDEVLHANKQWKSLIANNVWEPGAVGSESLWQDVTVTEPPVDIPDWVQPTGAHDAYRRGARVMFQGVVWENTGSDANVWQPGVFGWVRV
jgi:hypothetical protein